MPGSALQEVNPVELIVGIMLTHDTLHPVEPSHLTQAWTVHRPAARVPKMALGPTQEVVRRPTSVVEQRREDGRETWSLQYDFAWVALCLRVSVR